MQRLAYAMMFFLIRSPASLGSARQAIALASARRIARR